VYAKRIESNPAGRTVGCFIVICFRLFCIFSSHVLGSLCCAALITRVNVEVKRFDKINSGSETKLLPVAPQVLRQAEAFCIESGRRGLWNVVLDGQRWIFARLTLGAKQAKHVVSVSQVSSTTHPLGSGGMTRSWLASDVVPVLPCRADPSNAGYTLQQTSCQSEGEVVFFWRSCFRSRM
jgi:hypothetical protein